MNKSGKESGRPERDRESPDSDSLAKRYGKDNKTFKKSFIKAVKSVLYMLPALVGVVLLTGIIKNAVPAHFYSSLFTGSALRDALVGSAAGSILAGNPTTSYVIGGELLGKGVGLVAVTSFIVAWVTVGVVQLPVEAAFLGKRFSISRNISAFIASIVVAIISVFIFRIILL